MKIRSVIAGSALLISGLALAPGATSAQEAQFTVDPSTGVPGDVIQTQLDPEWIAEECRSADELSDLFSSTDGVRADFFDLTSGGAPSGPEQGSVLAAWLSGNPIDPDLEARVAFNLLGQAIAENAAVGDSTAGDMYLNETAILTFARISDRALVGERSNFDRDTGAGEITVPEVLTPGLWGLAATCAEPNVNQETVDAAMAAGIAAAEAVAGGPGGADGIAENTQAIGMAVLEAIMGEGPLQFAQFTVPREPVVPSPENEAFCGVLPVLQPLGDDLIAALQDLPADDGEVTDEEWAELADWDAINAEVRGLVDDAVELLATGDESRPDEVADAWNGAVAQLRQIYDAMEAIEYDFSTPSGRLVANQVADQLPDPDAEPGEPDPDAEPSDTEVLTQWFLDNCIPAAEESTPPPAEGAAPIAGRPAYTG